MKPTLKDEYKMRNVTIRMAPVLLERIDRKIKDNPHYANRSDFVRKIIALEVD